MSNHSMSPQKLILGAFLGALVGGTAVTMLAGKSGKKFKRDAYGKYQEIRENINDFVSSFEENISKGVHERTEEWADKAKETLEYIRDQVASIDPAEHKELGIGLLVGGLIGFLCSTMTRECRHNDHEGILDRISSWKPVIIELQSLIDNPEARLKSARHRQGGMDDVLDLAAAGLKLWNGMRK